MPVFQTSAFRDDNTCYNKQQCYDLQKTENYKIISDNVYHTILQTKNSTNNYGIMNIFIFFKYLFFIFLLNITSAVESLARFILLYN